MSPLVQDQLANCEIDDNEITAKLSGDSVQPVQITALRYVHAEAHKCHKTALMASYSMYVYTCVCKLNAHKSNGATNHFQNDITLKGPTVTLTFCRLLSASFDTQGYKYRKSN